MGQNMSSLAALGRDMVRFVFQKITSVTAWRTDFKILSRRLVKKP